MTEKILAVQQMQDYIAVHLSEKITLCDLSRAAGYSPFYCARIFKELTGLAPADYIRRIRLSESALRLRDEQCKVIDIAYDSGYDSVVCCFSASVQGCVRHKKRSVNAKFP